MISIIVPVYNVEQYLEQCLDSLLGQSFRDIEIICVNDGSTDTSGTILTNYALRDSRLRVITQHNKGVSAARNRGVEEARGKWLMFVDSDDWIDADTCERAFREAVVTNSDVVFWAYVREFENGKQLPRFLMDHDSEFAGENLRLLHRNIFGPVEEELRNPALLHSWGTVWGKLYTRVSIGEAKFTDTQIVGSAEDALFNAEVFNRVGKAIYVNRAMYHYRKQDASFTGGYSSMLNVRWVTLYAMFSSVIVTNNLSADFQEALNNRIALGLIGQSLNECKSPRDTAGKIGAIKHIITTEQYRKAIMNLQLKYFPIHWRLFFSAAKSANAFVLFIFITIIRRLK